MTFTPEQYVLREKITLAWFSFHFDHIRIQNKKRDENKHRENNDENKKSMKFRNTQENTKGACIVGIVAITITITVIITIIITIWDAYNDNNDKTKTNYIRNRMLVLVVVQLVVMVMICFVFMISERLFMLVSSHTKFWFTIHGKKRITETRKSVHTRTSRIEDRALRIIPTPQSDFRCDALKYYWYTYPKISL